MQEVSQRLLIGHDCLKCNFLLPLYLAPLFRYGMPGRGYRHRPVTLRYSNRYRHKRPYRAGAEGIVLTRRKPRKSSRYDGPRP
jgi:hypothetical protein